MGRYVMDDPSIRIPGSVAGAGSLARQVLRLADQPLPRLDFIRRLSAVLLDQSSSPFVELWVDDDVSWIRCRRWRSGDDEVQRTPAAGRALDLDAVCAEAGIEAIGREPGRVVAAVVGSLNNDELTLLPLVAGERTAGWLMVATGGPDYVVRRDSAMLGRVTETIAIALGSQRAQAALRERVKELSGLYEISEIARDRTVSVEQVLERVTRRLPLAWQYPETAVCQVELDGRTHPELTVIDTSAAMQQAEIVVGGRRRGTVTIGYLEPRPELDEGPFLVEERSLLEAAAIQLGSIVSQREAEAEQERLRDQLLHADRLATVGKLAAGVAHELNEPLGAVLGFAQLLRPTFDAEDPRLADLGKIETAALHGRDIVRKLLLFARQTPANRSRLVVDDVVDDAVSILDARRRAIGLEVDRIRGGESAVVDADPAQLRQVVVNLVANAFHATHEGGRVSIEVGIDREWTVIDVIDSGEGMSADIRDRAFLPFFTTRELHEGTGLGLAVVHGIVTAHGGRVEVESSPGSGSRFRVLLPTSEAPA